ncbi:MAG: anaerobic ribonucleoside-triphosphate reductase, partial [Clostridia bacterium]
MKVIKRDGKRVEFDGTKIALAIKKGFDSVISDEEKPKYTEKDINKVYNLVIKEISELNVDKIKIEEIQDLIEKHLEKEGYNDVYYSFSEYRERRAQSRKIFFEEKKQHKFLKALEALTIKRETSDNNIISPFEVMVDYGSTISKEFAKSYMVKKRFADLQDSGEIHIHDLNFMPIGTTNSSQINLTKLYNEGFNTKNIHIREPKDIMSYSALAVLVINLNQKEQHGCQSIPAFDYYMAPGVVCTFKKQFKATIDDILIYTDFDKFAATNGIEREIEKIETIEFDVSIFDKYSRESEQLKRVFRIAYDIAMKKTEKVVSQAMEAFIHDTNVINSNGKEKIYPAINLGTDTSPEGRMVISKILDAIDFGIENEKERLSPFVIFKVKEGINYNKDDINYDLYKRAVDIASRRNYPAFSFLDATFNKEYYKTNNPDSEVAYNSTNMRVMENVIDEDKQIASQRGNISYTTINLARIGIKNSKILNIINDAQQTDKLKQNDYEQFFNELEEKLNLVKEQLLDRFETQGNKKAHELPFFIKQGIWLDGEKARDDDKIRKVIKQGTLTIGFMGLEECLIALTGKSRANSKTTQELGLKIINFMKSKTEEFSSKYNLNFSLMGTEDEELATNFIATDKAIYGSIKNV